MNDEVWRPAVCVDGLYEVSNLGRVRNTKTKRVLSQGRINSGYAKVDIRRGKKPVTKTVHRLVAEAFVPKQVGKPEVNHRDADKLNNAAANLEWVNRKENLAHARIHGNWDAATWATSTTKVRGVTPHVDGGFMARVTVNGNREYLGYFKTIEEAAEAIQARKAKLK